MRLRLSASDDGYALVTARGRAGESVFAEDIPDVDWTSSLGAGAGLDFDLPLRTSDDLAGMFEVLRRGGWVTPRGRYAIHQTSATWHGAGASQFMDEIRCQQVRYRQLPTVQFHSEEHAVYVDHYGGDLYTLVLRVVTAAEPWILSAQFSLQLPGIPVDSSAILLAARALGVAEGAAFRSLNSQQRVPHIAFRLGEVPLEVIHELESRDGFGTVDERWISGLVVHNPFQRVGAPLLPDELRDAIGQTDSLVCTLSSWYTPDAKPTALSLVRIDTVRTASMFVVRAVAQW